MQNDGKSADHSCAITRTTNASTEGSKYEVVAGGLGTVYRGDSCMRASMTYLKLIDYAKAVQDVVSFFENGRIKRHFIGINGVGAKVR